MKFSQTCRPLPRSFFLCGIAPVQTNDRFRIVSHCVFPRLTTFQRNRLSRIHEAIWCFRDW